MPDDTSKKASAAEPRPIDGPAVSALASATAPFIYFDRVSNFGFGGGVVHMTLEAARYMSTDANHVENDRVVVAHLKMSAAAFETLKNAVSAMELIAKRQDDQCLN